MTAYNVSIPDPSRRFDLEQSLSAMVQRRGTGIFRQFEQGRNHTGDGAQPLLFLACARTGMELMSPTV